MKRGAAETISTKAAWQFVVFLGVVSLLADMTYEGARSITGPFLAVLGASATAVGVVAGLGELVGYGLRLVSGAIADRTQRYWAITLLGYTINLASVPLLALAGHWPVAGALIIAERTGKAIRTPARDAMLAHATHAIGRGRGFGLHEALDQIGALLGPLVVAGALFLGGGYRTGFGVLVVPAILALAVLLWARRTFPRPHELEVSAPAVTTTGLPRHYWLYLAAAVCVAAGYADFPLIAYHFQKTAFVAPEWIPILYAGAMGVDAIAALSFGHLFDRIGLAALILAASLSAFFAPLVFLGGVVLAVGGMALWGIGMGAQESIMRAAVAELVPADRRGIAYGTFNAGYGLFWFLGSALMGALYDVSIPALIAFSVVAQLVSIPFLLLVVRQRRETRREIR